MNGVSWRRTPFDCTEVVERNGFLVTGLLQTITDLACDRGFISSVAALDAAIGASLRSDAFIVERGVPAAAVAERLREFGLPSRRALRPIVRIAFADARGGVRRGIGEPRADAPARVPGARTAGRASTAQDGGVDIVDFDWPEYGAFGEFDGDVKYLRARYMRVAARSNDVVLA